MTPTIIYLDIVDCLKLDKQLGYPLFDAELFYQHHLHAFDITQRNSPRPYHPDDIFIGFYILNQWVIHKDTIHRFEISSQAVETYLHQYHKLDVFI